MDNLTYKILEKLNISPSLQIKKAIRGLQGINAFSLVKALISTDSIKDAANILGYSENPVKQAISTTLAAALPSNTNKPGMCVGKLSWRFLLLSLIAHKKCYDCESIMPFSKFGRHENSDSTGLAGRCKLCALVGSKEQKLSIKVRTPKWAELTEIREFYKECPEGYQVDHIIPLRGVNVSGLHVLSNLQYLTVFDNQSKSNKFNAI